MSINNAAPRAFPSVGRARPLSAAPAVPRSVALVAGARTAAIARAVFPGSEFDLGREGTRRVAGYRGPIEASRADASVVSRAHRSRVEGKLWDAAGIWMYVPNVRLPPGEPVLIAVSPWHYFGKPAEPSGLLVIL